MVYHHHASYSTAMPYDMPDFSLKKLLCGNEKNARCPGIWWAPKVGRHHGVVCSIMTPLNPLLVDIKHIHKTLRNANGHLEGVGFFQTVSCGDPRRDWFRDCLVQSTRKVRIEGDIVLPKLIPELFYNQSDSAESHPACRTQNSMHSLTDRSILNVFTTC